MEIYCRSLKVMEILCLFAMLVTVDDTARTKNKQRERHAFLWTPEFVYAKLYLRSKNTLKQGMF